MNEFINYEEALALKELGFDESCLAWYHVPSKEFYLQTVSKIRDVNNETLFTPLYQQAFRFFREKYNVYNIILPSYADNKEVKNRFFYEIANGRKIKQELEYHKTYEEAELACLKKLIEITKK